LKTTSIVIVVQGTLASSINILQLGKILICGIKSFKEFNSKKYVVSRAGVQPSISMYNLSFFSFIKITLFFKINFGTING
jgi:hypothetical protein